MVLRELDIERSKQVKPIEAWASVQSDGHFIVARTEATALAMSKDVDGFKNDVIRVVHLTEDRGERDALRRVLVAWHTLGTCPIEREQQARHEHLVAVEAAAALLRALETDGTGRAG